MKTQHLQAGFTLIEILVTLVIVSVAVLSLGNFTISMVGSGQVSRDRLTAVHIAEQVLEFWQHDANDFAPTVEPTDCSLSASGTLPTYALTATCTPSSGSGGSYTVVSDQVQASGPLPGTPPTNGNFTSQGYTNTPYTKVVTVTWSHQGKSHSIYLTHLSEVK